MRWVRLYWSPLQPCSENRDRVHGPADDDVDEASAEVVDEVWLIVEDDDDSGSSVLLVEELTLLEVVLVDEVEVARSQGHG